MVVRERKKILREQALRELRKEKTENVPGVHAPADAEQFRPYLLFFPETARWLQCR